VGDGDRGILEFAGCVEGRGEVQVVVGRQRGGIGTLLGHHRKEVASGRGLDRP
jgi:hypothetical protein